MFIPGKYRDPTVWASQWTVPIYIHINLYEYTYLVYVALIVQQVVHAIRNLRVPLGWRIYVS